MPSPSDNATSVFETTGLTEFQVWTVATSILEQSDRRVWGRADLLVSEIVAVGLQVEPDEPPPRHALIREWPSEKERQKEAALLLASVARVSEKSTNEV